MHCWSQLFIPTLREAPADAEVASHKFLVRAGYIRQLAAGIYSYLFLGQRSFNKITAIVREEMNAAGALEVLMPSTQPAELWQDLSLTYCCRVCNWLKRLPPLRSKGKRSLQTIFLQLTIFAMS